MRTAILLVLALLLVAPEAMAGERSVWDGNGASWRGESVVVYDFTASTWGASVQAAVDHYNTLLPEHAPTLVYQPMGEVRCDVLPPTKYGISLCLTPAEGIYPAGALTDFRAMRGREFRQVVVRFADDAPPASTYLVAMVCHELMHATTGVLHHDWSRGAPCPHDDAFALQVYPDDDHLKHSKHRTQTKHKRRGHR